MKLPQELYNKVKDEYIRRNGKPLPACSTCLQTFIREVCR